MKKDKEILTQRIQNGIAKPFSTELIKLIKPAIRIISQEDQLTQKSLSKFGGIPLMKKEEEWLRAKKGNNPYVFLLQLDLEEIKPYNIGQQLPEKGILSFWFNLDTWDDGKVIYYPNAEALIKADLPPELKEEEERKKLPIWKRIFTKKSEFRLFPECQLKFEIEYHAPSWDSLQIKLFHIRNNTKPIDLEIDEKYIDEYCCENRSDHHLFGYYVGLQESIYELMKITKGRFPTKLSEELIKKGLNWSLLMQIDSDKTTEMNWVDWGKILFFIQEEDLKKEDFDNIIAQLDTT